MNQVQETIIKIEGMSCGHCKMAVEKALQAVHGVVSANVNLEKKEALVKGTADRDALARAIEDAGFDVV